MTFEDSPLRTCPRCGGSRFERARKDILSYWAGREIGSVVCSQCGYHVGYGILESLPRFDPPIGRGKGRGVYSDEPSESPRPWLAWSSGEKVGIPWRSRRPLIHIAREWWVLIMAALILVGIFGVILYLRSGDNGDSSAIGGESAVPNFGPTPLSLSTTLLEPAPNPISSTPAPGQATTTEQPPTFHGSELLVQERVNQFRLSKGLTTLSGNRWLADVARAHSEDMANRSYFGHRDPEGIGPQGRVEGAGLADFSCGENLMVFTNAQEASPAFVSEQAFTGWFNSRGHYQNMVTPGYDIGGVGVFVKSKTIADSIPRRYDIYVTHLLCKDLTEYNHLKAQKEETEALYRKLAAEYDAFVVGYQEIEVLHLQNVVPYSEVESAYQKLQEARVRVNEKAAEVNYLANQMRIVASE